MKSYDDFSIDENFERWWVENGFSTVVGVLEMAFKEVARNAWEAAIQNQKIINKKKRNSQFSKNVL